ncbi:MAG: RNA polymerase subunit sigma-70 [Draconibacterium sp.]|nr:MAG: RNA polymerase subunit sigma-70 [Draconibacterium sp.]
MQLIPFGKSDDKKSDEQLLSDYLESGDLKILGSLYARYLQLVYGVCLKYFKEREQAKDAVMQLFEKLVSETGKHKINNFKSWLYVVTKNFCLMELRRKKPGQLQLVADEKTLEGIMENSVELHPIDREQGQRNEKALAECIEKLKKEQKMCIRLFYFESRSYREICSLMNLEEKKVKSYIQNGKRNLKICLENKDDRR